ncbi:hypothetical protein PPERSA_09754 [Pseudocohnilembus persalinus]|uniref:Peroxisomal biogenesis factor 11 n=1 Tax=Pseudocohnilembus persalinus TaxID=266149 RepID=A0A0V0QTN1_PSEPJ|nr:hypothetical protein PPERSA_09754 [Pseudocohnilembus persalinus]|eukprot:KRX05614.1 hypothetical protein PPERSA_09754 [Pseudocohnilembus persalinus]
MSSKQLNLAMLTKVIGILNKTDGRDKLGKAIQNLCKYLNWYYSTNNKDLADRMIGLSNGMRDARKLFRLFKSMNEIEKLIQLSQTDSPDVVKKALDVLARAFFAGYWFFDNLVILITVKFLKSNKEKATQTSNTFWFFGILFTQIQALYQINQNMQSLVQLKIEASKGNGQGEEIQKKIENLKQNNITQFLKIVQCTGDILAAGTGSKIFERLVGKTPNSGTIGLGGLVSALIAGYQMF